MSNSTPEDLTPEERLLQAEGENLISRAMGPQQSIVGPDGAPLKPDKVNKEADEQAQLRIKKVDETHRLMVQEAATRLGDIVANDAVALNCTQVILACHKLIFWAKMELASCDDTNDIIVDYAERIMRAKVEKEAGFHAREVHAQFKSFVMPFLKELLQGYELLSLRRNRRLKRVRSRLKGKQGGISVPYDVLDGKLEGGFQPSTVAVLHGAPAVVRFALKELCAHHKKVDSCVSYYLSSKLGENEGAWANVVMPPAWWRNAADSLNTLADTLEPVLDEPCALLVIEDLEMIMPISGGKRAPIECKVLALKRLYAWARENAVAVLVGDGPTDQVTPERLYGLIPWFNVEAVRVNGEVKLKVEDEHYPATEEIFE